MTHLAEGQFVVPVISHPILSVSLFIQMYDYLPSDLNGGSCLTENPGLLN